MNKQSIITILFTMLMSMIETKVFAHDIEVANSDGVTIYYKWINNHTELSVSYRGSDSYSYSNEYTGNVVIPKSVNVNGNTYPVTSIGGGAFSGCTGLTSVTIPNSVTSIGDNAFYSCYGLLSITIPNSVTSIGQMAFAYCEALTSITIPNSVTSIGFEAFACSSLTSITSEIENPFSIGLSTFDEIGPNPQLIVPKGKKSAYQSTAGWNKFTNIFEVVGIGDVFEANGIYYKIGENNTVAVTSSYTKYSGNIEIPYQVKYLGTIYSVTSIGNGAFEYDNELTSVIIPNSVTSIDNWAFAGCTGLATVNIPNSVSSIGKSAFSGCSDLTSVAIPSSVIYIGNYAFSTCSSLTSVVSEIEIPFAIDNSVFNGIPSSAQLIVPKGKKSAYQSTAGWNKFTNIFEVGEVGSIFEADGIYYVIDQNNTVSVISGKPKYSGDVVIPNQVTYLGTTYSVTIIGSDAFASCSGLTSITIPNSVTSIGEEAFINCSSLASVTIPNSVTSIGFGAFIGCSSLVSVTIPSSMTFIDRATFEGCSSLASITIPNSVRHIGGSAFDGTAWYNNQPDGLIYAGKLAYRYKGEMPANTHITLENGTLGINLYAFSGCSNLTSVTIPNSVTIIGQNAFSGCSGLTSVTIPNSVTSIVSWAFSGCTGLTTIVSEIEDPFAITNDVFSQIPSYAQLIVPKGKKSAYQSTAGWDQFTNIVEVGGVGYKFEVDGIYYKIGQNNTVSVISGRKKYSGDVVIPSQVTYLGTTYSVTSIGDNAFEVCSGLTSITIPGSVTGIGNEAFHGCTGLTSVTISNGVKFIGMSAFWYCSGLTSITIPNSVIDIEVLAFDGCSSLTSVKVPVTDFSSFCQNKIISLIKDHIGKPVQLLDNEGKDITNFIVPNDVTSIGGFAFYGCSGLTSVIVGKGVQTIGNAFDNCNNLREMILSQTAYENGIPESVTKFTTYSKNPMLVVVTSKGATSATMKIYPIDDSGNTNESNSYTVTMQGLTPEQYIKWKLDDENYGIISEKTSALTLTTQPAQPTSTTKARLTAMVNEADDDQHYGFEWLRNEAPDNMVPNKVSTPLYNGKIIGTLSGLNPDIYYKYRPYYKAEDGTMLRGEWVVFLTGDANVFFEPLTHTKEVVEVTTVSAQLAGVWIEGTEDIEEKGFEYWRISGSKTRGTGSDVKKVIVTGNNTTATIEKLVSGKEYGYHSYIKTASGVTYGEDKTFTTVYDGSVNNDDEEENVFGDVNVDHELDNKDVNAIVQYIMEGKYVKEADLNNDNKVNAADIVLLNKILINKGQ